MKYGRKKIVKGVYDPRNRNGFGLALEHLSRYLNLHIDGLETKVRKGKVFGQTQRKKGVVVDISAYFSNGQDDGIAEMHYSVGSKDGRKAKERIEEIGKLFPRYSGPFASSDSTTPTSSD